jgi:hypothetical protein
VGIVVIGLVSKVIPYYSKRDVLQVEKNYRKEFR